MLISLRSRVWNGFLLAALLLSLLGTTATLSPARADSAPPDHGDDRHTPLGVTLSLADMPPINQTAEVTIAVSSSERAAGVLVGVVVSQGLSVTGRSEFVIDLAAGDTQTLLTGVTPQVAGNHSVSVNVSYDLGDDNVWGDTDAVYFHSRDDSASEGYTFAGDPASGGAMPGPDNREPVALRTFADGTQPAFDTSDLPPAPADDADLGATSDAAPEDEVPAAAGELTIRGATGFVNRDDLWQRQSLLVQLLDSDGQHVDYTYSDLDGNFVFSVGNFGQFSIRVWAHYYHESMNVGAIRVVADGFVTPSFKVSGYNYTAGEFGPFADGEVNIGSWGPDFNWEGRRAWWVYQDLFDAFAYTWDQVPSEVVHGSRQPDGVTVEWSPGSTDGAYYSISGRRVHLEDIDANSAHIVVHEYGHAVMHNVYGYFPVNDCPSPHVITQDSGSINCSWTEGWANFFAIAVLTDPVFKWGCALPCTPSALNLEDHSSGLVWDLGQFVEGNVAASLWDFIDPYQDGFDRTDNRTTPFWMIWDNVYNYNHDNFSEFWFRWKDYYNETNSLATMYQNTIDFGWPSCPDWSSESDDNPWQVKTYAIYEIGPYQRALCTHFDADYQRFYAVAGRIYTIETLNLGTASDGSIADTTLTIYGVSGETQLAFNNDISAQNKASRVEFTAVSTGYHFAAVRHTAHRGVFAYTYSIDFTETIP